MSSYSRWANLVEDLCTHLVYAVRTMSRSPLFVVFVVLTVGLVSIPGARWLVVEGVGNAVFVYQPVKLHEALTGLLRSIEP